MRLSLRHSAKKTPVKIDLFALVTVAAIVTLFSKVSQSETYILDIELSSFLTLLKTLN